MQFECTQCHKPLKLPDDKLPRGKAFSFTCPYCKTKNTAMIPEAEAPAPPPPEEGPQKPEPPLPPTPLRPGEETNLPYPEAGLTDDEDLAESADERRALVVYDDPDVADMLLKKLDDIGYRGLLATNIRDAARHIKLTKFHIILLQEDYMGASLTGNHLLRSVQNMDNRGRRGTVVVLISPDMATLDDLAAFAISVDAIVNSADIEQIGQFLLSSAAQSKKLYSVFEEILAEHGLD